MAWRWREPDAAAVGECVGVASPTTMIVPEENWSIHRRIAAYGYREGCVKSVANNSNPVKGKLENRLTDASGVRVEIRTRAFGAPAKIVDARRLGHLVGLTRGKNGSCQAE